MFRKLKLSIIFLLILLVSFVGAVPHRPQGNILGDNIYSIINFTYVNATYFYMNGTLVGGGVGDITAVNTGGPYLSGGASSGDVDLLLNDSYLNSTIDARDDDTTYTSVGLYVLLSGTQFSFNESRMNSTIDARDSDTTYSAGTGLSLSGTTFSLLWTSLSNFTDDLGDRGYNSLSNFSNDLDLINGSYANNTYVLQSSEANLNVNSSDYWDALDTPSDITGLGDSQITSLSWSKLASYPSACNSNETITTLADTVLCTAINITEEQVSDLTHTTQYDLNVTGDSGSGVILNNEVFDFNGAGIITTSMASNTLTITGTSHTTDTNCSVSQSCPLILYDTNASDFSAPGDCPSGEFVQNTTSSGVECLAPAGGGTVTSVGTDNIYLFGGPITGSGTISLNETTLNGTIDARDDDTTYTASGTLLDLTGTAFSVNEGTLTTTKWCKYTSGTGLDCNVEPVVDTNETTRVDTLNATKANIGDCSSGEYVQNTTITGVECGTPPDLQGVTSVTGTSPVVSSGGTTPAISLTLSGDLATTSPITGGVNNIFPGSGTKATIGVTVLKDLVAGDGMTGGENDVFVGGDADTTITLGTPSTLTGATSNALTATSHTHAITTDSSGTCASGTICAGDHTHPASQVTTGTFGSGNYVMDTNLTVERIIFEGDTANHRIYDNASCIIIKAGSTTLEVCE